VAARRLDDILAEHLKPSDDIHFMVVDVEGSERAVIDSLDLGKWRPWVVVVEATAPNSTEQTHERWERQVLDAGYELCLFDGLSRFYVAEEHAADLRGALSVPANPLDSFVSYTDRRLVDEIARLRAELEESAQLRARHDELLEEVIRWRGAALTRWAEAAGVGGSNRPSHEVVRLRNELAATHSTVSWRVTAPLRAVQSRRLRGTR
jgi:hypothetical protein